MSLRRITQKQITFSGNSKPLTDDPPKKKGKTVTIGGINFLQSEVKRSQPDEIAWYEGENGKLMRWTVETNFGTFVFDDHTDPNKVVFKDTDGFKGASIMSGTINKAWVNEYIGTDKADILHLKEGAYIQDIYTAGDFKKDVLYLDKASQIQEEHEKRFYGHKKQMDAFDEVRYEDED